MIDAGDFHPAAERAMLRTPARTFPPRLTTTDEQMHEVKRHLEGVALTAGATSARATVHWTRGEPTVVEMHGHLEHLTQPSGVESLMCTDRLIERTLDGHEIPRDERVRLARLKDELAAMREHSAGPTE